MLMFFGFCQQTTQKMSKAAEELLNNALITGILNRCLQSNLHKSLLEKFCIYILVTEYRNHISQNVAILAAASILTCFLTLECLKG